MAKSTRSKTKRAFRRVKRESGVFAAADAARLHRLSSKLRAKLGTDADLDGDVTLPMAAEETIEGGETEKGLAPETTQAPAEGGMELDSSAPKKVSTSGRRLSRRDSWRLSKGMPIHSKNPNKMDRLGGVAGKRKAGRSKRRR